MYSDYRQRHISVSSLEPGDTLEYRTVTRITTALAAGHFWYEHRFPKGVVVKEDRLEIDVPKSREVKLKAPVRRPEIQEKDDRRIYTWVVKDIKTERDHDRDDLDDDEDGSVRRDGADWVRREERRVDEWARQAEERAVLPFLECEILKRRRPLHPDYDDSKTYFVRPFGVVMDIIARMDVILQQSASVRTWWKRDDE